MSTQRNDKSPLVFIIILNWNGWKDTIECLQSLYKIAYPAYKIVIVDNHSEDDSLQRIGQYVEQEWGNAMNFVSSEDTDASSTVPIVWMQNPENMGFAKGNNVGIRYAEKKGADYVILLNNDTVVEKNFLQRLVNFKIKNDDYLALTPQIRYYSPNDKIWNCGGKIYDFGIRKYFFNDQRVKDLPDKEYLDISFITGCAMFLDYKKTGLLSENFFFGEEDFEFSMRMKKSGIKIACVLDSVILHKVSSSVQTISQKSRLGIIYIYYLNRFINMRSFMNNYLWKAWRLLYAVYIYYLLWRKGYSLSKISFMVRVLMLNSTKLSGVTKAHFQDAVKGIFFKI